MGQLHPRPREHSKKIPLRRGVQADLTESLDRMRCGAKDETEAQGGLGKAGKRDRERLREECSIAPDADDFTSDGKSPPRPSSGLKRGVCK